MNKKNDDSKYDDSQLYIVYRQLRKKPQTMLEVSKRTGILRTNIPRLIHGLRKFNIVYVTKVGKCPISNHKAQFFTTNKDFLYDNTEGANNG